MVKGVTGLRYVGLAVPDLDSERRFFTDVWGLIEVGADGEVAYFAAAGSTEPFVVRVRGAGHKGLDLIGLAAESRADVDALAGRLADEGVKIVAQPHELASPGGGYGVRFFDPDGRVVEVSADVAERQARELRRGESIPATLSHVVLHAPEKGVTEAFYREKLGFRVSDEIGHFMSFLRCNSVHHCLALLPGPPALNHVAFEMRDINEMMRGVSRLARADVDVKWGPGRHTAGDNTFSYFQTPNGHTVEYTAEVQRVGDDWQATRYEPKAEIMDQWGTAAGGPDKMGQPEPDPGAWQPVLA